MIAVLRGSISVACYRPSSFWKSMPLTNVLKYKRTSFQKKFPVHVINFADITLATEVTMACVRLILFCLKNGSDKSTTLPESMQNGWAILVSRIATVFSYPYYIKIYVLTQTRQLHMFWQLYFEPSKRLHHTHIFPGTTPMKNMLFLCLGLCSDVSGVKNKLHDVIWVIKLMKMKFVLLVLLAMPAPRPSPRSVTACTET